MLPLSRRHAPRREGRPLLQATQMSMLAVIQARDGSTRLPGKIRADIGGASMLAQVVHRVSLTGLPFVVAMPQPGDNEDDVLSRFVRIARKNPLADAFVRITADCPLLDSSVVGFVVGIFRREGACDFAGTHPDMDGLDCEVFSRAALLTCDLAAHGRAREHVTSWMRRNLSPVIVNWAPSPLRWSVDDVGGLDFVRRVYGACELCARGVPHHTNSATGIGGVDRTLVIDLHQTEDGGLAECRAADILRERVGGPTYVS